MEIAFKELNSIISKINGAYHDVCTRFGISDSEFDIFYTLCDQGDGCNQSLIYKKSGLGKSTINSAIKKMEREGYLVIKKGAGRNTKIYLTDSGRKRSAQTAEKVIEIENRVYKAFNQKSREDYIRLNNEYLIHFLNEAEKYGDI